MHTDHQFPPAIFEPFPLQHIILRNRLIVAPMSRVSAASNGTPTPIMEDYYTAFANGGFGMIITEGVYTDDIASRGYPLQPGLVTPAHRDGWQRIAAKVRGAGAHFICQLMHAGALSQHHTHTWAPAAVSPLGRRMPEYGGGDGLFSLPQAMTTDDIHTVRDGFVHAAQEASVAGFSGIEIHAANGYLLDQFLTDYTNLRTDEYGGAITNRYRLIAAIIQAIRQVTPAGFIIGLRLSEGKVNNLRYRWPQGPAAARELLTAVAATPPDYIHIAAESGNWERDCMYMDGTSFTSLAKQIVGVPVIANGGLHEPAQAAKVLEQDHADLLALGKAALCNPDWPQRIRDGLPTVSFHPGMIKPSAAITHTRQVSADLSLI
ncbi:NADH:flavin oxidoreductase [Chitinophaga agrisoli]|uniref:NADH:flavin oxidoreductase n=1 Tax=Chitinophaga agrisoli TaxID=2607653 RepID=A0A5B2VQV6_9BACT|nr:NADH:flavin oxidoreductase [Chitinophaga agrisoli]KAA2240577.1 NADH:flavin oxidoreductase [Chitinophaga agrisoli]